MKVIVINERDIKQLIDSLKLEKMELSGTQLTEGEIHRRFHYIVVNWVQEHGSSYPNG